jgi:large subunit ribosomal protein L31e
VVDFTQRVMKTKDVRMDTKLNEFLWSKGIRNVPFRVRVRLSRKRNEDENAKEEMYTLVQYVPIDDFRGMRPEKVENE